MAIVQKTNTVLGDTWDTIALRELGSEHHTSALMLANRQYIGTVIFPAGVGLVLPEIPEDYSSTLPPWRRNGR